MPMKTTLDIPHTAEGRPKFALEKSDDSIKTIYTHDWCDETTWYQSSGYEEDEVATDSGDHTTYNLDNTNVIDTYHGKLIGEDWLTDSQGRSYRVVVKVNDVVKTEQDPHTGSGGDYTINYSAGTVTFLAALQESDVVKVTYHYAQSSLFTLAPITGKILKIDVIDLQCSDDIVMNDSISFSPYGYVDVFAPQYKRGSNELSAVVDKDLSTPPGSPDTGDRYIVGQSATGDWAGHEDDIAQWGGSSWSFSTPSEEDWTTVVDESMYYTFRSSQWNMTPYPPGTKIDLQQTVRYKTMRNIIEDMLRAYPSYPEGLGGTGWRGLAKDSYTMNMDYVRTRPLFASYGMEIRISLDHDAAFGGAYASATFYCASVDEPQES